MRYCISIHAIISIAASAFVVLFNQVIAEENAVGNSGASQIRTDIFFDIGSIAVRKEYAEGIAEKFAPVVVKEEVYVRIIGHANQNKSNPEGRENNKYSNLELGVKRALSVAKILVDAGVPENKLHIVSMGSAIPNDYKGNVEENPNGRVDMLFSYNPFNEYVRNSDK